MDKVTLLGSPLGRPEDVPCAEMSAVADRGVILFHKEKGSSGSCLPLFGIFA